MNATDHDDLFDDEEPVTLRRPDTIDFRSADNDPSQPTRMKNRPHRLRRFFIWLALIGGVALGMTVYLRYCSPYAVEAQVTGHISSFEKRGLIFKTYEGEIRQAGTDSVITFSVESEALAREIADAEAARQPVTLIYEKYYGTLPWRGESLRTATALR